MADLTEAQTGAALQALTAKHETIATGVAVQVSPAGAMSIERDIERFQAAPYRRQGTVVVHDAAGFAAAVTQRLGAPGDGVAFRPAVYADEENKRLVAVLNDDSVDGAGWRDMRVELALRPTPAWTFWKHGSGDMMDQENFAAHVEEGRLELVTPAPAEMLELAQTFQATTAAKFHQGSRLADGRRQFQYDEELEAQAGTTGQVIIPSILELGITPFYGADRFVVTALFRFRLQGPKLTLGYILDRPYDIERAAFNKVVDAVAESLAVAPIAGVAPGKGGRG